MPYVYVKGLAKAKGANHHWAEENLSQVSLRTLLDENRITYLVLTHTSFLGNERVTLNLADAKDQYGDIDRTVTQWLTDLGSESLPTQDGEPVVTTGTLGYSDLLQAGYDIDVVGRGVAPGTPLPIEDRPDLLVSRPGLDHELFENQCLFTVNGLVHLSVATEDGFVVYDGAKSQRHAKLNTAGILSFREVGEITSIPITEDMIYKQSPDQVMRKQVYLDIGVSVEDKIPLLVLGGYLHLPGNVYSVVGESLIKIDLSRVPLETRLFESRGLIDLSSLPFVTAPDDDTHWLRASLASDDFIKAYLTLPQSFVVLVDAPDIVSVYLRLDDTHLPGVFVGQETLRYPMVVERGRLGDYVIGTDTGKTVYSTWRNMDFRYIMETTEWEDYAGLSNNLITGDWYRLTPGYLLKAVSERVTIE